MILCWLYNSSDIQNTCDCFIFQQQGAATTVYCAVANELEGLGGLYFNNCCRCEVSQTAADADLGAALWQFSIKLLHSKVGQIAA